MNAALCAWLAQENCLALWHWWLDDHYRYNELPFQSGTAVPGGSNAGAPSARKGILQFTLDFQRSWRKPGAISLLVLQLFPRLTGCTTGEISCRQRLSAPGDEKLAG